MEILNIIGDDRIGFKCSRYLHRYCAIDENFKESLLKNYLWFSDPLSFNDPYDCNLEELCDGSFNEVLNYFREINVSHGHHFSDKELIRKARMLATSPEEMEIRSKAGNKETISKLGVCCFSEQKDNLLMWSHYADKHTGVCLTFDIKADSNLFARQLMKVEYPELYPIHRFPADYGKYPSYRFLVATKSKDWSYEHEVRVIRDCKSAPYRGAVAFNKVSLAGITFGYKCPLEKRNEINALLQHVGGYESVKFYSTKLKKLAFGIEIQEIDRVLINP